MVLQAVTRGPSIQMEFDFDGTLCGVVPSEEFRKQMVRWTSGANRYQDVLVHPTRLDIGLIRDEANVEALARASCQVPPWVPPCA
ncbi:hypothetical protein H5410_015002 [Solanum commersonii]|uniref:Uncharacterized protein n=1 Tax=Solanum commersonii TaxID=4109 RepID=A0A9J5ZT20_SOLCO|nr:hypothetical protein H5410_015002 [Solanum commersonii]